jgi:hypothetical protein
VCINIKRKAYGASQVYLFFPHHWLHSSPLAFLTLPIAQQEGPFCKEGEPSHSINAYFLLFQGGMHAGQYVNVVVSLAVWNAALFCFYKMYLEMSDSTRRSLTRL